MAKELESEASKGTGFSVDAIQDIGLEELARTEAMHQEALAAIAQRRRALVEGASSARRAQL